MIITFPHLGNVYLAARLFFEELKIEYVVPKKNTKATLRTGAYYSPEEICLPFKLMMGNFLDSIKRGANTILTVGSCGPCRFGEYCELQIKLLKNYGYDVDVIVIDSPAEIGKEFWERIAKVTAGSKANAVKKIFCLYQTLSLLKRIDYIDSLSHHLSGYEINKGECKMLLGECKHKIFLCANLKQAHSVAGEYIRKIKAVRICKRKTPIKIALLGEIYTMIEPFSNMYIEDVLMESGVSTKRLLTPSWWLADLVLKPIGLNSPLIKAASKKYLPAEVGGHAKESIAHIVRSKLAGFDGAIQIFPLGCMPEIVVKSVLPSLHQNLNFPVLTLIMDEITGETGYMTRIEAFLDMLESKTTSRRQHA